MDKRILLPFFVLGTALAQSGSDATMRALDLYRHGDCKEAETLFQEILSRQPKNVAIRKLYASCLAQTGHADQARAQYQAVLAVTPGDTEAQRALGSADHAIKKPVAPAAPAPG